MEEHIFSADFSEKVVWFVGLKNTIFCAPAPKESAYLKVYGTVEIQQGTKLQFSTTQLIVPDMFLPPEKVYGTVEDLAGMHPYKFQHCSLCTVP